MSNPMEHSMNTNLLSIMAMKDNINIYQLIGSFLMMNIMPYVPSIKTHCMKLVTEYFAKKKDELINISIIKEEKKELLSSITFIQIQGNQDVMFNAINNYIISNDNAKRLKYNNKFSVINTNTFILTKDYNCNVISSEVEEDDAKLTYKIIFTSYTKGLVEMKQFIDKLSTKYLHEQKNKLGIQKFFFDEKHVYMPVESDNNINLSCAPKNITFTMTPFHTNKSLKNIFGNHLNIVKDRVDMFLNNKEWYINKGVPYTLGILLHGPPGTGKTSLIKAIAKDTNRHVINIKLHKDTTQTQLRNLFYEENLNTLLRDKNEHFNISIDDRIYVIEDIDCLTDVLNCRKKTDDLNISTKLIGSDNINELSSSDNLIKSKEDPPRDGGPTWANPPKSVLDSVQESIHKDEYASYGELANLRGSSGTLPKPIETRDIKPDTDTLSLSFMLNLLDGILETPGRILIVTTNHVDKLDEAFLRPGRIDINLEVGYCTIEMIVEMFNFFYDCSCDKLFESFDYKTPLTPAVVNKYILNNYKDPKKAYDELNLNN